MFTTLLGLGLVIVPGLYAYLASQRLLRYVDEPLFAERVTTNMGRIASGRGWRLA